MVELSFLSRHGFSAYSTQSTLEYIALKAMPILLLYHLHSKNGENIAHLSCHLCLWKQGDIPSRARKFLQLMMNGIVKDALCLLSDDDSVGVLPLNSDIMALLVEKHLKKCSPLQHTLINRCTPLLHHLIVLFLNNLMQCWLLLSFMVLQVFQDWIPLLGDECVHLFRWLLKIYVMLWLL